MTWFGRNVVGLSVMACVAALLFACAPAQALEKGPEIPAAEWKAKVLDRKGVVVVDFWATWCGPCRKMKPIFQKVSEDLADKAGFLAVDVDQNGPIAEEQGVQSIPTFVLFKDGQPVSRKVGAMKEEQLRSWIEEHLD